MDNNSNNNDDGYAAAANGILQSPATANAEAGRDDITTFNSNKKKRKVDIGPIIIHGLRIPREVVAQIIPYCDDRLTINNLGLSCRGAYNTIYRDRKVVRTLPWPKSPFPLAGRAEWHSGFSFCPFPSMDGSRLAVLRKYHTSSHWYNISIWDQFHGLIGEYDWPERSAPRLKTAFSPDGKLMLAYCNLEGFVVNELVTRGIQVVQLPCSDGAEIEPFILPQEISFRGTEVHSVAFLNNDTVAIAEDDMVAIVEDGQYGDDGIDIWKVERENGRVSFSFSHTILKDIIDGSSYCSKVASFSWGCKTFLVIVVDRCKMIFHDFSTNKSRTKTFPPNIRIDDLGSSKNGILVASCTDHRSYTGHLFIFDLKVNTIEEIGSPRNVCISDDKGYHLQVIDFSADGMKVAVRLERTIGCFKSPIVLLDLQTDEVLSDRFLREGEDEWDSSAWNAFIN